MKLPFVTIDGVSTEESGVATHCPYCALQCATALSTDADGRTDVTPLDFPTNRGGLCQKGWSAPELLTAPGRLLTPLIRSHRGGEQRRASWDDALDLVAESFRDLADRHGPDAIALFGGGGLTNEKAYLFGKFARVALSTRHIDYNGRFCMSSAATAGNLAFGLDRGLPFPLADLGDADAVLLTGQNTAETMPPAMVHLSPVAERGGLIVVDPRRTATAAQASLHLQPTPGTDLALANGLLHVVIAERLTDNTYIAARTVGFDAVRRAVADYWPEQVERITGVAAPDIRRAARLLAGANRAYVLTGRGAEQHAAGTDTVSALINLGLALGLPGVEGSGYGCITGQGNGQGGREHGQKSDQLPGYRILTDPAARAHVAGVWGIDPDSLPPPGPSATEMFAAIGTASGPRALMVLGSNIVVSAPRAGRVRERLSQLDLLVVADVVGSETAQIADVVFPVTQWAEEEGTITSLEGRVLRRRRATAAPAEVRSDLDLLSGLAARLGHQHGFPTDPRAVFDELRRASAGGIADYAGIDYDRLDAGEALFWPCPASDHPGTPRVFLDRFATPDGRARFIPVRHRPVPEDIRPGYPVYLTTGRVRAHYQSGAQTRRVTALVEDTPDAFVQMHPDLAAALDVEDGDLVAVHGTGGRVQASARITAAIRADTVFVPFHWPGAGCANLATSDTLDPFSKMPEFKACAARVERVESAAAGSSSDQTTTGTR